MSDTGPEPGSGKFPAYTPPPAVIDSQTRVPLGFVVAIVIAFMGIGGSLYQLQNMETWRNSHEKTHADITNKNHQTDLSQQRVEDKVDRVLEKVSDIQKQVGGIEDRERRRTGRGTP